MSADEQGYDAADMARAGHGRDARRTQQGLEGGSGFDGDGESRTQDDGGAVAEGRDAAIAKVADSQLDERAEYHEALPDERDDAIFVSSWAGPFPHPDDFNKYPEPVQAKLLELYETQVMRLQDRQDRLVDSAIELDRRESDRQDALVRADAEQVPRAQQGSVILNLSMIALIALAVLSGHDGAVVAIVSGMAGINAMGLYVSVRNSHKK